MSRHGEPSNCTVRFRVTPTLLARMKASAAHMDRSLASYCRVVIESFIDTEDARRNRGPGILERTGLNPPR